MIYFLCKALWAESRSRQHTGAGSWCYNTSMLETLLLYLGVSLTINICMFLIAFRLQSDKLTDMSYAVTFMALTLFGFLRSDGEVYHMILLAIIAVWAVRIGSFLLYRVMRAGKDQRFDGMRESFFKFIRFWILQAITVWVLLLPSLFAFESSGRQSFLVYAGLGIWAIGLVIESVADFQKYRFSQDTKNKGTWIDVGIWRLSRHPNYFGEILVWIGVYLIALVSLTTVQAWIGLISPVFITILLLFVSGIPLLEKSADKKWGHLKEYQAYKAATSVLVPFTKRHR